MFRRSPFSALILVLSFSIAAVGSVHASELRIGLNFEGSTFLVDSAVVPPDTSGAVGPDHIVEMINGRYSVYSKIDGARIDTRSLTEFWIDAGVVVRELAYNPRVLYDHHGDRWYAVAMENPGQANSLLVAGSISSDPVDGWHAIAVDTGIPELCSGSLPSMGMDEQSIVVIAGMTSITGQFPPCPDNVVVVVSKLAFMESIQRAGAPKRRAPVEGMPHAPQNLSRSDGQQSDSDGEPPTVPRIIRDFWDLGGSYQAVVDLDYGGMTPTFLHNGGPNVGGTQFAIYRTDVVDRFPGLGEYDLPFFSPDIEIAVSRSDYRNHARQPPPKMDVEILHGNRFHSSMIRRNGSFWAVHTVLDFPTGLKTTLRWYRIDADSNELQQEGLIVGEDKDLYYGSIAVNEFDDVVIGFNASSETDFIGSYAVLGQTEEGVTSFGEPQLLRAGQAGYEVVRNERNRWGQYSTTVVDPVDPRVFWTFQEVVSAEDVWSTQITQLIVVEDGDGDGVIDQEDVCPESDLAPTVVIDGCDTGFENSLDAGTGCTLSDRVGQCASGAGNHGAFVSCVARLVNSQRESGGTRGRGGLVRCAAQADLP